jgi:hypothetical protein
MLGDRSVAYKAECINYGGNATTVRQIVDTNLVGKDVENKAALSSVLPNELFGLKSGTRELYARSIDPCVNQDGIVVDKLSGFEIVTDKGQVKVGLGNSSHNPTKSISISGHLPRIVKSGENLKASVEVVGEDGSACTVNLKFVRNPMMPEVFTIYDSSEQKVGDVMFGGDGKVVYPVSLISMSSILVGKNGEMVSLPECNLDLSKLCLGGHKCALQTKQDGRPLGAFDKLVTDESGNIFAAYHNGTRDLLGKCVLSRVPSPEYMKLDKAGTTYITPESGAAVKLAGPSQNLVTGQLMSSSPAVGLDYAAQVDGEKQASLVRSYCDEAVAGVLNRICRG